MKGEWIRRVNDGSVSVVFVHGILSSGENCWQHANGSYWPELLKNETGFESLGIYVYTYQTSFTSGSYSLSDVVDDLKERLINLDHVLADSKVIFFVCHSMGGIVVRKFLVERIQDLLDRKIEIGLYLVASPSLGSNYANWLEPIAKFAGHAQAQALRFSQDNQWLNDLDKTFQNLKESDKLRLHGKELVEDKFVTLKRLILLKQVVEPFSGARYFGESYKVVGSDHFSIAKPENKRAIQHRLLLEFIKKIQPKDTQSKLIQYESIFPTDQLQSSFDDIDSAESIGKLKTWQIELKAKLTKQLQHADLVPIVDAFIHRLVEDNPGLKETPECIAEFLVTGQSKGGVRGSAVLHFLSVAVDRQIRNQNNLKPERDLFAYLLQTLVRRCEIDVSGLTSLSVRYEQTAELINTTRNSEPLVPDFDERHAEFKNGKRKSISEGAGDYKPVEWASDPTIVCQKIAEVLLKQYFDDVTKNPEDALETLTGRVYASQFKSNQSQLRGIYIDESELSHHPFNVPEVVEYFVKMTENSLPILIYGAKDSLAANDCLHLEEGKVRGLIVEGNEIVKSNKENIQEKQSTTEKSSM